MKKRLNNTDIIFIIALIFVFAFFTVCLSAYPYTRDEACYISLPFRIVSGDSLVKHEWHLTQFSSLFSYLPTLLWVKITGSTEGIVVGLRFLYLLIQTALTVFVYIFFRKQKCAAVIAAILFYTQGTHIMMQISYHTMWMFFPMLLTICLVSIYEHKGTHWYVFAGLCYGASCVCDPSFCLIFILYIILCVLWKYQTYIVDKFLEIKNQVFKYIIQKSKQKKKNKYQRIQIKYFKKTKKRIIKAIKKSYRPKKKNSQPEKLFKSERYEYFFSNRAILYIFIGIVIMASIAIIFFFSTGATLSALFNNIDNLLKFSEYAVDSGLFKNLIYKITRAASAIDAFSLVASIIFSITLVILIIDKKRTLNSHRCIYLAVTLIVAIVYAVGMILQGITSDTVFIEFPFFIYSLICYILTKNKNSKLFYCMWVPGAIASVVHFYSAGTLLSSLCITMTISNTAGVFWIIDLFKEMHAEYKSELSDSKKIFSVARSTVILALSLQLVFHFYFYQHGWFSEIGNQKATVGPYAGITMTDNKFRNYSKSISDLDLIKAKADIDSPIYIISHQSCWMYLYVDLPIASQSSYYLDYYNKDMFPAYYKENPDRIPKYIYVDFIDYYHNYDYNWARDKIEEFRELFTFTEEELSNGMLLTVTDYHFDYSNNH